MREVDPAEVRRVVREVVERSLGPAEQAAAPATAPSSAARRVAIGSDHGGYELKQAIEENK